MAVGEEDGPQLGGRGGPAAVVGILVPKGRSKETHKLHTKGEIVFVSFNIETAGEQVGIVQISGEVFRLDLGTRTHKASTKGKSTAREICATCMYCNEYPSRPRVIQRICQSWEQHQVVPTSHREEQPLPAAPIDCRRRWHRNCLAPVRRVGRAEDVL